jgi:putative transcriptional regulator
VNTVENAVFVPSTRVALQLARALDSTVEDLFTLAE